jgi:membrane protein
MASLKERAAETFARLREKFPWLDHTVRMVQHYGVVNGNGQAGAITYFGFLSFFPILALGFFVIGLVAKLYPDIQDQMVVEINKLLPGMIGNDPGQIPLDTIESYSGRVGLIGLLALLYAGLGWLSGLRQALEVMFVVPRQEQTNFLLGKLRDLGTLGLIGLVLMVSVALSSAVTGFSGMILGWVGIDQTAFAPNLLLTVLGHVLAIAASTVLLLAMFKLLIIESHVPRGALVRGALLGAVGFEVLKLGANLLLAQTRGNPAFQAFGVALILLVWINYFSRLVMYSVAWAYTSDAALEQRTAEARRAPGAALATEHAEHAEHPERPSGGTATARVEDRAAAPATVARSDVPARRPEAGHRADRGVRSWRALAGAGVLALVGAVAVRGFRGGGS